MDRWYKDAIVYAVDVARFRDADGDGWGDFRGLTEKLDYLHDLGVTCIWLLPFYPSPLRDNGYDVADHYGVDDRFGTAGDFVDFLRAAEHRGMRVIVDLVINHTSKDHPWFQKSAEGNPRYADYYIWRDEKPDDEDAVAFPGEEESVWEYDERRGAYYYHSFFSHEPDLHVDRAEVVEEIEQIMGFWLQLGVSGFRLDAATPMRLRRREVEDRFAIFRTLRERLAWRRGDAVFFAEADDDPEALVGYVENGEKIHVLFNFLVNQHLWLGLARGSAEPFLQGLRLSPSLPEPCDWAQFLRNLDELNLDRLPEHARQEVFSRFAPDEDMRIFGRGIRRRLAPMLGGDGRLLRLLYAILFGLPGVPTIMYGDEIGMGEDLSLDGRESVRLAMQWSPSENGGFSAAAPSAVAVPVRGDGDFGYSSVNVSEQLDDEESLLSFIRGLVHIRKRNAALRHGDFFLLDSHSAAVAVTAYRYGGKVLFLAHNFSDAEQILSFDEVIDHDDIPALCGLETARSVLSDQEYPSTKQQVRLEPHGFRWFELEES